MLSDDEIKEFGKVTYLAFAADKRPGYVERARIAFARKIEAVTLERAAQCCMERGERNRIAAGKPNGDRDEFYCADDIRRLAP